MSLQSSRLPITLVPLSQIRRPVAPVLDPQKIDAMVSTARGVPAASATCSLEDAAAMDGQLPPVDVMHVRHDSADYYFAFGGCHRLQAYDRMAQEGQEDVLVRCKLLPATRAQMRTYVGASVDNLFN
ncbi:ADR152C-Ap [Eremothecium gossypii ATCC 10895]|uniref:Sulfiredoxin n=1 Tax=Eremothecium gossypii (strain ATCC 10895 / CBS 109.51 / FGSC 9923 / NRRL Y-1056) TaxID=284811 RepID=Q759X0_EREGS|nr:ADR152C-Ap [Eremothecium gossypii ATCC 10895]AAS52073.1 ADR152C-Ap [Eremothecium gossypii ATCC 10895]AEY96372.1 FADR152C-Ap [Eremothecium gossypii FDAG1]